MQSLKRKFESLTYHFQCKVRLEPKQQRMTMRMINTLPTELFGLFHSIQVPIVDQKIDTFFAVVQIIIQ